MSGMTRGQLFKSGAALGVAAGLGVGGPAAAAPRAAAAASAAVALSEKPRGPRRSNGSSAA